MLNKLKKKISNIKSQQEERKLRRLAEEHLKDFKVSVSLEDSERFLSGLGKVVVTMENKANKKAIVEIKTKFPEITTLEESNDFWHFGYEEINGNVSIIIEGKKICSYDRTINYDTFSKNNHTFFENMIENRLPERFNVIYEKAVIAAAPEVVKKENQLRQEEKARKVLYWENLRKGVKGSVDRVDKKEGDLHKTMISNFMNRGRS